MALTEVQQLKQKQYNTLDSFDPSLGFAEDAFNNKDTGQKVEALESFVSKFSLENINKRRALDLISAVNFVAYTVQRNEKQTPSATLSSLGQKVHDFSMKSLTQVKTEITEQENHKASSATSNQETTTTNDFSIDSLVGQDSNDKLLYDINCQLFVMGMQIASEKSGGIYFFDEIVSNFGYGKRTVKEILYHLEILDVKDSYNTAKQRFNQLFLDIQNGKFDYMYLAKDFRLQRDRLTIFSTALALPFAKSESNRRNPGEVKMKHAELEQLLQTDLIVDKLADVKSLNLKKRNLFSLSENDLKYFKALEMLDISENSLEDFEEDLFIHLASLKTLHMNNCDIETLPEKLFDPLKNLEELYCIGNSIAYIEEYTFKSLTHLKVLDLRNNYISQHFTENIFLHLGSLEKLLLDDNSISFDVGVTKIFTPLKNLKVLSIESDTLDGFLFPMLNDLKKLVSLRLPVAIVVDFAQKARGRSSLDNIAVERLLKEMRAELRDDLASTDESSSGTDDESE